MQAINRSARGPKPKQSGRARDLVLQQIRSGAWPPGYLVPVEAELARLSGISQPTAHRELRRLLDDGLLVENSAGRRLVAGASSHLMSRTIVLLSQFAEQSFDAPLARWAASLDHSVQRLLLEAQWRTWGMHPGRLSDAELQQLAGDPPIGAILFTDDLDPALAQRIGDALEQMHTPLVVVGSDAAPAASDSVASDHYEGGRMVVRWLAAHGCSNLIAIHRPEPAPAWHNERQRGHRNGAAEAGLPPPAICAQRPQADPPVGWLIEHLRPLCGTAKPIGIIGLSDGQVPELWAACRELGLRPGKDVLISGYDGYWDVLASTEPRPSVSVDKRPLELAQAVVHLLTQRLAGGPPTPPERVRLPPRLIEH